MPKESHRTRPIQTAKRKQKPLGQEERVRKKSKTKATTNGADETTNVLDEQEDSPPFISPEKYLGKEIMDDDGPPKEFVSPLKYIHLADGAEERPPAKSKRFAKKQSDKESSSKPQSLSKRSEEKESSTRPLGNVERSNETHSDRFVRSAQEDLMQMIERGASDRAIENQLKIIKMLQARVPSQVDETRKSSTQRQQPRKDREENPQPNAPKNGIPKYPGPGAPRHPSSIPSDSDSDSNSNSNLSPILTPFPASNKCPTRISTAKAKSNREVKELIKTARPASAPTSLPATQRSNKALTIEEVAELSTVHPTFDQKETNRFERHTRKFNGTRGMASDKPLMPERGLESRIRAPTSSPEVETKRSSQYRLDAAALSTLDSATAAADTAATSGRRLSTSGSRATPSTQPTGNGNRKANSSPRELEESVRIMSASLASRQMPSRRAATLGGRPGQVWNETSKRWQWQYVEEVDSDDD